MSGHKTSWKDRELSAVVNALKEGDLSDYPELTRSGPVNFGSDRL
ncbi:MAG: hypothetical protein R2941_24380 [Desulfobacterales bacterium]